jgi:hypothetical protein
VPLDNEETLYTNLLHTLEADAQQNKAIAAELAVISERMNGLKACFEECKAGMMSRLWQLIFILLGLFAGKELKLF